MQILVIEDEKRLARALKQILEEKKYQCDVSNDGLEGYEYALSGIYDVIVLDVMLPGKNGIEIASDLRKAKIDTPIIMLTARDSISDKIKGLDAGADDYMSKPFSPNELLARIRALTRRQGEVVIDETAFGDIKLNISTSELIKGDKSIHLNYKEAEILKLLIAKKSTIVSKDEIITKVWGYDSDAGDSNVEAYISFIRKKFSFVGANTQIVSIKKLGYKLEAPNV